MAGAHVFVVDAVHSVAAEAYVVAGQKLVVHAFDTVEYACVYSQNALVPVAAAVAVKSQQLTASAS